MCVCLMCVCYVLIGPGLCALIHIVFGFFFFLFLRKETLILFDNWMLLY